jgi:hypothetical protein
VIAGLEVTYASPDFTYDTRRLMPQNGGGRDWQVTAHEMQVSMAQTGRMDFDANFLVAGISELNFVYDKIGTVFVEYSSFHNRFFFLIGRGLGKTEGVPSPALDFQD